MAAATITASVLTGGSNNHATTSEEANAYATDFVAQGIVGAVSNTSGVAPATGGFAVNQDSSPDMGVTVSAGVAYISATPAGQAAQVLRAKMSSNYTIYAINANSSGSTKYDWIYLKADATNAANPDVGADNVANLFTSRSTSISTDTGSPPTYGILLAVVTVANGATSITNANISDRRTVSTLSNGNQNSTSGWQILNYPLTYSTNSGDKLFVVTSANDLTGILSPGMRLKISRAVTPPSQCATFVAASTQYATKASPSGLSFTGAYTCEGWVKLSSYTGLGNTIISRRNGSVGAWALEIGPAGQPRIYYGDGSSNFTIIEAYQSIPLNVWVHITGVVTSVASKTGLIYINGTSVTVTNSTNAATSLVQAGNLTMGSYATGTAPFNGELSEVRVWSVAQTAADIKLNMGVSLVGNEANLVFYSALNGNFNDATSNGNNLVAAGGAIATTTDNPYNATEFATILADSYSVPTTTLTLDTANVGTIPNQTLNNPYYSTQDSSFGLPISLRHGQCRRAQIMSNFSTTTAGSYVTIPGLSVTITVPTGAPSYKITAYIGTLNSTQAAGNGVNIAIVEGSTLLATGGFTTPVSSYGEVATVFAEIEPTAGSHTYLVQVFQASAGTLTATASTTEPSFIKAEPN